MTEYDKYDMINMNVKFIPLVAKSYADNKSGLWWCQSGVQVNNCLIFTSGHKIIWRVVEV